MLGPIEFLIRLMIRYGGTISFALMAGAALWAVVALLRDNAPSAIKAGWAACLVLCAIGMTLCAAEARRGIQHIEAVFAALNSARPPLPTGVSNVELSLADEDGRDPIGVRVWFPDQPTHTRHRLLLAASGFGGDRDQIALLLAALAREGYTIVAFDDLSQTPAPAGETAAQRFLREGPNDYSNAGAYAKTLAANDVRVDLEARKALYVLDRFSRIANAPGQPWRSVDLSRVGFIGYSFGGAVAAEASARDSRIGAVINLDGALFGQVAREGIVRAPYLLMLSDMHFRLPVPLSWSRTAERVAIKRELKMAASQARQAMSEIVEVPLSEHDLFTDSYFDRAHTRQWLTLAPTEARAIVMRHVLDFLDRHLPASDLASQMTTRPDFDSPFERQGAFA